MSAQRDSAWSIPLLLGIASSVVLVVGGLGWYLLRSPPQPATWRLMTGAPPGVYSKLGDGLEEAFADHARVRLQAIETAGSRDNLAALERGDCELALIQDDTPGGDRTRTVAILYPEYLHILVRSDIANRVGDIGDLKGMRVVLGQKGSGTAAVAADTLAHFDLAETDFEAVFAKPDAEIELLRQKKADVAFVLSALPSTLVDAACSTGLAKLLSLGSGEVEAESSAAAGMVAANPRFRLATIPARTYGEHPTRPVHTIGVRAVLVATKDADPKLVRAVASRLFRSRIQLARHHPAALRLREDFRPEDFRYPAHDGAEAYFRRGEPPFVVQYAEVIAFAFSVIVGLFSGIATLRRFAARSKKERIDTYYKDIALLAAEGAGDPQARRSELLALRKRAFQDLVDEKLAANASFTIFQDLLRSELETLDATRETAS